MRDAIRQIQLSCVLYPSDKLFVKASRSYPRDLTFHASDTHDNVEVVLSPESVDALIEFLIEWKNELPLDAHSVES